MLAKLAGTSVQTLLSPYGIEAPDIVVTDLVLDSREVAIHKGFVAVKGHARDGREFIPQAISLGAKVILAEADEEASHGQLEMREQSIIISFFGLAAKLSELAARFYDNPAQAMDVIAVTGTNGKTSTVSLCTQLRDLMGDKPASIGTLGQGLYNRDADNSGLTDTINTTPDALQMQRLCRQFVSSGAQQVALEASSHALVQGRVEALKTDVAIFTNLTRDHLDYHGTMAEYARAKRLLLNQPGLRYSVVNVDDPEAQRWIDVAPASVESVVYGIGSRDASIANRYVYAQDVTYHNNGTHIEIDSSWGKAHCDMPLLGPFNVSNLLAAMTAQLVLGQDLQALCRACEKLQAVPGRMEVFTALQRAPIVVDYAHTPDGLEQALKAARSHCHGELYCVFGCGGDRDQGKRSLMGEIAEKLADHIVLTNDNSRSESPAAIVDDILSGMVNPEAAQIELERETAIANAWQQATDKDLVLVAGKGHENYQIIGTDTLPYNEREYVLMLVKGKSI